jgi:tetratricopeptide (TPR) repeat protein
MNRELFWRALVLPGILLILAGEIFYWHDSIVSPGYRAIGLPLFSGVIFPAPLFWPLSYGMAALLLLAIAFVANRVRHPMMVAWCAFFLLILGLLCPLQIGFSQPSWLDQYWQNHLEYTFLTRFTSQHSYPDMGPAVRSSTLLGIDGLYDRGVATILSLKIGWTFHTVGSLLFLAGALAYIGRWNILRPHAICAAGILFVVVAANLAGPLAGETCWNWGLKAERMGKPDLAASYYHWAMSLDAWNRYDDRVYERLGAIAEAQNRVEAPEYHFLQGLRNEVWGNNEPALAEFTLAMSSSDPFLSRQARYQYAALASNIGQGLYQSNDAPGTAALYWQKASPMIDEHIAEDYMGARGLQDAGQYDEALKSLAQAQADAKDALLQSQVYSSLGDVYYLRKDVAMARLQYLDSTTLVQSYIEYKNLRAEKNLTDNLQP